MWEAATVADRGRYPPVMPLPRHIRSGRIPHSWLANIAPVRPNPVATSSQMSGTPRAWTASANAAT